MCAKRGDRAGVQGDLPVARVGLRLVLVDVPVELHDLLTDGQPCGVEVHVGPRKPAGLTAAQPAMRDQVEQGVERVMFGSIKEGAELGRSPHHDRGRRLGRSLQQLTSRIIGLGRGQALHGFLPALHPRRGPHEALRACPAGQLHQRGGIDQDQPLADRVVERGAQCRAYPLPVGVAAGHLGQALGDVHEPHLGQTQVPQAGAQVLLDVLLVAAQGGRPDVAPVMLT